MANALYLIGLNHRSAPVEVREQLALDDTSPAELGLITPQSPVQELLLLSTCNRVEILAVGVENHQCFDWMFSAWANTRLTSVAEIKENTYQYQNLEAVTHIFQVASSLDSMIVGEPQILGQLKDAYRLAVQAETTGTIINRLLHKAFSVAKRIRTETSISKNAVSISYAAVELAKEIFADLSRQKVMLIGAGEMAELAAEHLVNNGLKEILISNRTYSRALELAQRFQGRAVFYEDLLAHLPEVDIVISSTGAAEPVIRSRDMDRVMKKRKNKPMFFIDIAVPRDIDPDLNQLDNIYLYDIDDLKGVVEDNLARRKEESRLALSIIEEEVKSFQKWFFSLDLKPAIVDLLERGREIADVELEKTLKKIETRLSSKEIEALQAMVSSLSKKLYHHPITYFKAKSKDENAAHYYTSLLREIFQLDSE